MCLYKRAYTTCLWQDRFSLDYFTRGLSRYDCLQNSVESFLNRQIIYRSLMFNAALTVTVEDYQRDREQVSYFGLRTNTLTRRLLRNVLAPLHIERLWLMQLWSGPDSRYFHTYKLIHCCNIGVSHTLRADSTPISRGLRGAQICTLW